MKLINTYQNLPAALYRKVLPTKTNEPSLIIFNKALAKSINLKEADTNKLANWFSGNELMDGSIPIAQAYAGHQFGQLNILGDGRAVLLGETYNEQQKLIDIQLKGSGITPFSRNGDGKATLSAMLREYLISEAMYALNIPTTRSLAVTSIGETIMRQTVEEAAVLTRCAESHLRVGTFVYAQIQASNTKDNSILKLLVDYAINRHYPQFKNLNTSDKAIALLEAVLDKQALLIAHWTRVGFIHGVLNTDNVAISGEGIDYGPCAFMDTYHTQTVFSSIDYQGRYAFKNQMPITWWNIARFAESLLAVINKNEEIAIEVATKVINTFNQKYETYWHTMLCNKIGLNKTTKNLKLANELLELMQTHQLDYTNSFKQLTLMIINSDFTISEPSEFDKVKPKKVFDSWITQWKTALKTSDAAKTLKLMQTNNPMLIPRNHLVEAALQQAKKQDFAQFNKLLKILQSPYEWQLYQTTKAFQKPATTQWNATYKTFCGT